MVQSETSTYELTVCLCGRVLRSIFFSGPLSVVHFLPYLRNCVCFGILLDLLGGPTGCSLLYIIRSPVMSCNALAKVSKLNCCLGVFPAVGELFGGGGIWSSPSLSVEDDNCWSEDGVVPAVNS